MRGGGGEAPRGGKRAEDPWKIAEVARKTGPETSLGTPPELVMSPIDHRTGSPALTAPCRKQPGGTSLKCNARTTGASAGFPKEFAKSAQAAGMTRQPPTNKTEEPITTRDRRGFDGAAGPPVKR